MKSNSPNTLFTVALAAMLVMTAAPGARSDGPSAGELVHELIKRHGGPQAVDRWKCGTITFTTSAGIIPPQLGTATISDQFDFPRGFKRTVVADTPQRRRSFAYVFNEDGGWFIALGSPALEIDRSFADRERHKFADLLNVGIVEPHIADIQVVGHSERNGEDTICLQLESDELGSCKYFVSSDTGLLVEYSRTNPDPATGAVTTIVTRFDKYKEIDGIPVPMSISATANGKQLLSVEIQDLTFKDSLPPSTFAAPE